MLFGSLLVESFEEDAGLADFVAGHKSALFALLLIDGLLLFVNLDALGRVDDVDYGLGADALHLLYQFPHVSSVGERTVDALG